MWRASILTLFPDMFPGPLGMSLAGDALARGAWTCDTFDIRDHGLGRHRAVDDRPAGGGPGMVLRADVVAAALDGALPPQDPRPRFLMSPRGRPLTQNLVRSLAAGPGAVLVCGRFEGVDERLIEARGLIEMSVGDYVLSGGEMAALVLLDAVVRLLPGVMGAATSGLEESFENGLLEYPHYTRPREFEGHAIPAVLLGGDHAKIAAWRTAQALGLTRERRPDLLEKGRAQGGQMTEQRPGLEFVQAYEIESIETATVTVRHRAEGHWWRFEVAEKNGRRQLVHADHENRPTTTLDLKAAAIDAYDTATLEARQRGMVD